MTTVLFAGGGTGGHLMPALAIAEAMIAADSGVQPFFVGGRRGIESMVLPARPWRHALLPLEPIYRRQWWKNVRLPFSLARSLMGIGRILAAERPALVVGTGGYVSGPVVWAAMRRGIPAIIQEQNALPGLATRRLAGRVAQIHLGFPEARPLLEPGPRTAVFDTGNPIVPPPATRLDRGVARRALGLAADAPVVLVIGGSQGSLAINRIVDGAIATGVWPASASLVWQTGPLTFEAYRGRERAGRVRILSFIDPMADAYAAADLVVARAGAMTLAELAAWGLPSILIPLPTAAANHQLTNARATAQAGAGVVEEQASLTPEKLGKTVTGLLAEPARMAAMASAARSRGRPQAATEIAREALRLVSNP